jgi:hypothetical protein
LEAQTLTLTLLTLLAAAAAVPAVVRALGVQHGLHQRRPALRVDLVAVVEKVLLKIMSG